VINSWLHSVLCTQALSVSCLYWLGHMQVRGLSKCCCIWHFSMYFCHSKNYSIIILTFLLFLSTPPSTPNPFSPPNILTHTACFLHPPLLTDLISYLPSQYTNLAPIPTVVMATVLSPQSSFIWSHPIVQCLYPVSSWYWF
jgi:hypothetical protein